MEDEELDLDEFTHACVCIRSALDQHFAHCKTLATKLHEFKHRVVALESMQPTMNHLWGCLDELHFSDENENDNDENQQRSDLKRKIDQIYSLYSGPLSELDEQRLSAVLSDFGKSLMLMAQSVKTFDTQQRRFQSELVRAIANSASEQRSQDSQTEESSVTLLQSLQNLRYRMIQKVNEQLPVGSQKKKKKKQKKTRLTDLRMDNNEDEGWDDADGLTLQSLADVLQKDSLHSDAYATQSGKSEQNKKNRGDGMKDDEKQKLREQKDQHQNSKPKRKSAKRKRSEMMESSISSMSKPIRKPEVSETPVMDGLLSQDSHGGSPLKLKQPRIRRRSLRIQAQQKESDSSSALMMNDIPGESQESEEKRDCCVDSTAAANGSSLTPSSSKKSLSSKSGNKSSNKKSRKKVRRTSSISGSINNSANVERMLAWYEPTSHEDLVKSVEYIPEHSDLHSVFVCKDEEHLPEPLRIGTWEGRTVIRDQSYIPVRYPDSRTMTDSSSSSNKKRRKKSNGMTKADDWIFPSFLFKQTPSNMMIRDMFRLSWLPFWYDIWKNRKLRKWCLNEYFPDSAAYRENGTNELHNEHTAQVFAQVWKPELSDEFELKYRVDISVRCEVYFNANDEDDRRVRLPICVDINVPKNHKVDLNALEECLERLLLNNKDKSNDDGEQTSDSDSSNDRRLLSFDDFRYRNPLGLGDIDDNGNLKLVFSEVKMRTEDESSSLSKNDASDASDASEDDDHHHRRGQRRRVSVFLHFGLSLDMCEISSNQESVMVHSEEPLLDRLAVLDWMGEGTLDFKTVSRMILDYGRAVFNSIGIEGSEFCKTVFTADSDTLCWQWTILDRSNWEKVMNEHKDDDSVIVRIAFLVNRVFCEKVYRKWNELKETPQSETTSFGLRGRKLCVNLV